MKNLKDQENTFKRISEVARNLSIQFSNMMAYMSYKREFENGSYHPNEICVNNAKQYLK